VITSAAAVMVITFAMFATGDSQDMKQLGVGLAVAILIDATIVRAVLLPATMKLLGDWNWYLPRWLQWLPRLEGETPAPGAAQPPGSAPVDGAGAPGVPVLGDVTSPVAVRRARTRLRRR
jgi:RND superfamily putative drug exporter